MSEALAIEEIALLREAFDRFHSAGARLEERYNSLVIETEALKEALVKKEEEVKQAERLAMLGTTAAAVAHEVRNPLGAIKLFTSMLKRSVASDPQLLKLVDSIERGVTSIDAVVSNILVFAKDRTILRGPVNIGMLLHERTLHFRSIEPESMVITTTIQGTPWIQGDEESLRRALSNLFLNATQAMNHVGEITIQCTDSGNGLVEILFSDSGPGFSEEIVPHLFEPFRSTKPSGTGLGLAIVAQTIKQHGGTITAFNTSSGAVIKITLPKQRISEDT